MTQVAEGNYSEHLLRTLASVPPVQTILEIGSGWHTRALAQLGFDFYSIEPDADRFERTRDQLATLLPAESIEKRLMLGSYLNLPYTSEAFDWVVAYRSTEQLPTLRDVKQMFAEAWRVMKWGAWIYVAVPYASEHSKGLSFSEEELRHELEEVGFVVAERMAQEKGRDQMPLLRTIYRKVNEQTPL